ncbi:MAG TPA: right-handed parallel beta-helix repeat-containing protein, partial [bacterium]
ANSDGGGIYCSSSNPSIVSNAISENAADYGGGISCSDNSSPNISGNAISANWGYIGVGIRCEYSSPSISGNTISENSTAFGSAAGIYCYFSSPTIIGNTISGNSGWPGGGIYCGFNSSPTLLNCVLWENGPQQIYVSGGSPQVNYSDIQGGYTGTGNINADPLFINYAQHDYRLQWGSPCIDSGDPNPIYNDPDGTRADMGAWYYDQTMPVRILLTPYNAPIQIPPEGGSFQYAIQVTNISSTTFPILVWCNITLPSGMTFGPVLGPVRISLVSGQTISRVRTQNISGHAPAGLYHYNAFAVAAGDTSSDSFTFTKLGAGGWDLGAGGWTNAGESFDFTDVGARRASPLQHASRSGTTPTMEVMPNPFNPITVASFELRVSSYISLRIYDTAGRLVKTLVDGWREVGAHEVTFDGSQLPSGIYFADLTAGDYSQVQKLILLK